MSSISQRFRCALRALLELTQREGGGYISVPRIAEAQAIPPRFLETTFGDPVEAEIGAVAGGGDYSI